MVQVLVHVIDVTTLELQEAEPIQLKQLEQRQDAVIQFALQVFTDVYHVNVQVVMVVKVM